MVSVTAKLVFLTTLPKLPAQKTAWRREKCQGANDPTPFCQVKWCTHHRRSKHMIFSTFMHTCLHKAHLSKVNSLPGYKLVEPVHGDPHRFSCLWPGQHYPLIRSRQCLMTRWCLNAQTCPINSLSSVSIDNSLNYLLLIPLLIYELW